MIVTQILNAYFQNSKENGIVNKNKTNDTFGKPVADLSSPSIREREKEREREREREICMQHIYGVEHMVKDHSVSSKGSFIYVPSQTEQLIPLPLLYQSWSTGWN